jgi:hypothetical protein
MLSERRAWSVHAFVTNDPDAWEVLYNHPDEDWGLAVIQEILADLGYEPGEPDGDMGPLTRAAMRAFLGLAEGEPVENNAAFRKQLFGAYMSGRHDIDLPPERFVEPGYMGCGEFNPAVDEGGAREKNRRVTFFFVHPDRVPKLPCAFADVGPCKKQMVSLASRHTPTFRCSFFDSFASRCTGAGTTRDIIVLFHVPPGAREDRQALEDWYVLTCDEPVFYHRTLYAADAEVVAPNRMALVFRETPLAGRFTLRHFYDGDSDYVVFEGRTHSDLLEHIDESELPDEDVPMVADEDEAFDDEVEVLEDEAEGFGEDGTEARSAPPVADAEDGEEGLDEPDPDADETWVDSIELFIPGAHAS